MSSRPASSASSASTVAFGGYLDRVYDENMKEAEVAYAAHLQAAKELHQAQMDMMRSKRAIRTLNDQLSKATAAAAKATELVDRKRKAADAAAEDFDSTARMTRHCYSTLPESTESSTQDKRRRSPSPFSPVYYAVSPVYSAVVKPADKYEPKTPDHSPGSSPHATARVNGGSETEAEIEQESQDPYGGDDTPSYCPVSKDYVPQNPAGDCNSPRYNSPTAYCRVTGEPIYGSSKTYCPTTPSYCPISPAAAASAKRASLKWGA